VNPQILAPNDEELMAAYVAGDQTAFAELFRRYAPILLRLMQQRISRTQEAEDLVQQTFLQLHRSRHDFRAGARLRPWLFTIALNLRFQHFRESGRRRETPLDITTIELGGDRDPNADLLQEWAEQSREVQLALTKLPPDQRNVIILHWLEGLSFAEVSRTVGASVNAVKVRAHRGYIGLRKLLKRSNGNRKRRRSVPLRTERH
jgi:RNA polymerase sigma-70 factor (ECF subfamily)